MGVFVAHAHLGGLGEGHFGNACVQVFFALSGFLIGGLLTKSAPKDLPRFYFNRATRIWVPYAIATGMLLAATALRQGLRDPKLWEFFFYKATFVYNAFGPPQLAAFRDHMPLQGTGNHFWSICVEEQFYLIAPFVIVLLRRRLVAYLLLVGLVVLNFFYPHNFAAVALGVLLALSRDAVGPWYLRVEGTVVTALILVSALVLGGVGILSYTAAAPFAAVALVALLARPRPRTVVGAWLGGISYPFYLNHWIGLFFQKKIAAILHSGPVLTALAAFVIAFVFNAAHYRFVDSVVMARRGRWFTPRVGMIFCATGILLVVVGLIGGFFVYRAPLQ